MSMSTILSAGTYVPFMPNALPLCSVTCILPVACVMEQWAKTGFLVGICDILGSNTDERLVQPFYVATRSNRCWCPRIGEEIQLTSQTKTSILTLSINPPIKRQEKHKRSLQVNQNRKKPTPERLIHIRIEKREMNKQNYHNTSGLQTNDVN